MMIIYHLSRTEMNAATRAVLWGEATAAQVEALIDTPAYEFVGMIDTDDLEEAFDLTQNHQEDWVEGEKVVTHKGAARSSNPGDVFIAKDGCYWVKDFGFEKVRSFKAPRKF